MCAQLLTIRNQEGKDEHEDPPLPRSTQAITERSPILPAQASLSSGEIEMQADMPTVPHTKSTHYELALPSEASSKLPQELVNINKFLKPPNQFLTQPPNSMKITCRI